jgi:hypothetical protein
MALDPAAEAHVNVGVHDEGVASRLREIEARLDAALARLSRKEAVIRVKGNISDLSRAITGAKAELETLKEKEAALKAKTAELGAQQDDLQKKYKRTSGAANASVAQRLQSVEKEIAANKRLEKSARNNVAASRDALKVQEDLRSAAQTRLDQYERTSREADTLLGRERAQTVAAKETLAVNEKARLSRLESLKTDERAAVIQREMVALKKKEIELQDSISRFSTPAERQRVDVETGAARRKFLRFEEELRLLGRDPIKVRAEVDTRGFSAFRNMILFWNRNGPEANDKANDFRQTLTKIGKMNINLGPFNASLKGLLVTMVAGAPVVASLVGSLGSLVSVLGSGLVGAAGLGGAALAGFGLAAGGLFADLKPIMGQLSTVQSAFKTYQADVMKYGPPTTTTTTKTSGASAVANAQGRIPIDQARVAADQTAYDHVAQQYGKNSAYARAAALRLASAQQTLASAQREAGSATSSTTTKTNQSEKAYQRYQQALKSLPPQLRAGATEEFKLRTEWDKLTKQNALNNFGDIVKQTMTTARSNIGWFSRDTNTAFNDIRAGWDKWMAGLRTPEAKNVLNTIFVNFDKTIQPVMHGLQGLGTAALKWFATMSRFLPGMAKDFSAWGDRVNANADATSGWYKSSETLMGSLKDLGHLAKATGKFLFALFKPGVGPGQSLVEGMTKSLQKGTVWLDRNQKGVQSFFKQSVNGAKELWRAIKPIGPIFINLAKGFAPIAKVAADIVGFVGRLTANFTKLAGPFGLILRDALGLAVAFRVLGRLSLFGGLLGGLGSVLTKIRAIRAGVEAISAGKGISGALAAGRGVTAAAAGTAATGVAEGAAGGAAAAGTGEGLVSLAGGALTVSAAAVPVAIAGIGATAVAGLAYGLSQAMSHNQPGVIDAGSRTGLSPTQIITGGNQQFGNQAERANRLIIDVQKKLNTANVATLANLQERLTQSIKDKAITNKEAKTLQRQLNTRGSQLAAPRVQQIETALMNSIRKGTIGRTGGAAGENIAQGVINQLNYLPRKAKEAGGRTMVELSASLEAKGKLPRGTTNKLIQELERQWGPSFANKLRAAGDASMQQIENAIKQNKILDSTRNLVNKVKNDWIEMPHIPTLTMKNWVSSVGTEMDFLQAKMHSSSKKTRELATAEWKKLRHDSLLHFGAMASGFIADTNSMAGGLQHGSKSAADTVTHNFNSLSTNIHDAVRNGLLSTKQGTQLIHDALNKTLKAFGSNPIKASVAIVGDIGAIINKASSAIAGPTNPAGSSTSFNVGAHLASGGRVPGSVGPDNWTLVDPSGRPAGMVGGGEILVTNRHTEDRVDHMLSYFGTSLGAEVAGENRMHSSFAKGGRVKGFSTGGYPGYVTDSNSHGIPGGDMHQGQEPQILRDLYALSRELRATVNVNSGYRTPAISVSVGGFADDPHTRGEAADIAIAGVDMSQIEPLESQLKAVGLYRPLYPSMGLAEDNHVQLLGGGPSGPVIPGSGGGGAALGPPPTMKVPKVKGKGTMATLVRDVMGKSTKAANDKIRKAFGAIGGGFGSATNISGPIAKQIFHAATQLGFNKIAAAGIIGNAMDESSLNPNLNDSAGVGLFSWDPSTNPAGAARAMPLLGNVAAQVSLATHDMENEGSIGAMNASGSPGDAALYWNDHFEHGITANRVQFANDAFAQGYSRGGRLGRFTRGGRMGRRFARGGGVRFGAGMSIETDGVGPTHGDSTHISDTSYASGRLNADRTHFTALYDGWRQAHGISLGDVEQVRYRGHNEYAIVGDSAGGGSGIHGEGSYSLARALGIPDNPNTGGVGSGVEYTIFPGSRSKVHGSINQRDINRVGARLAGTPYHHGGTGGGHGHGHHGGKGGGHHGGPTRTPGNPANFTSLGQIKWFTELEKAKKAFYDYKYRISHEYHTKIAGKPGHWNTTGTHFIPSTIHKTGGIPKSAWLTLQHLQHDYQDLLKQHPKWKTKHAFSSVFDVPPKDRIGGIGFDDIDALLAALKGEYASYRSTIYSKVDKKGNRIKPSKADLKALRGIKAMLTKVQHIDQDAKAKVQDFTLVENAIDETGTYMDEASGSRTGKARGIDYGRVGQVPGRGKNKNLTWEQWRRIREHWQQVHTNMLRRAYRDVRRIFGPSPTRWQKQWLNILSGSLGDSRAAMQGLRQQESPASQMDMTAYIASLKKLPGQVGRDELVRPGRFTHQRKKNDRDDPFGLGGIFGGEKYHTVLNKPLSPADELQRLAYYTSIDQGKIKEDNPNTSRREDLLSSIPAMRDAQATMNFYKHLLAYAKGDPKVKHNLGLLTEISDALNGARSTYMGYRDAQREADTATGPTQFQMADTARAQMFGSYASNVAPPPGSTSIPGAGIAGAAAATAAFSPTNPAIMRNPTPAPAAGGPSITVNNHYKNQPHDPHTWSAALAWELQGSI